MRILVLHQAVDPSREDEADTLVQVKELSTCLEVLGHTVFSEHCSSLEDIKYTTLIHSPDVVFNLIESFQGSDKHMHLAAAAIEKMGIPYTGVTADCLKLLVHKQQIKTLLSKAGIRVPSDMHADSGTAYIVKSATEHASFGMDSNCVVTGVQNARALCQAKQSQYGGEWLAEEYIDGQEVNLSLLETAQGMQLLPLAEIIFENWDTATPRIVDYAAKWDSTSTTYNSTTRKFLPDDGSFLALATQCWNALGLRGYARIDLRLDTEGNAYVIDVNPNPCLSADAGFVAAAQQAGLTQTDIVQALLKAALHEHRTETPVAA